MTRASHLSYSSPCAGVVPARSQARLRARVGMTLIELTVGIVVTGLVVSAGYAAFSTIIDQRDRAAKVAAETAKAVGIRQTIFQWLDGSLPEFQTSGSTNPNAAYELAVVTNATTPMRTPATRIRFFIDDGRLGYGRGLVAVFRPEEGKDSIRVVLDSAARDLVIEYLASPVPNGTPQWYPGTHFMTQGSPSLGSVKAVRMRVISYDPIVSATFANPIIAPIKSVI